MVSGLAIAQPSDSAAEHYRLGVGHYKEGQYALAISEFRAADAIRPSPVLSFNEAQCYEKLADLPNAKAAYQDYLRRAPNADDRPAIEATIASIDQKLAQQQRNETVVLVPSTAEAAAQTPVAAVTSEPRRAPNYTLGAAVASVGVAGLVAGVIVNALSHQQSNSLQNNGVGGQYWTQSQVQGYYDSAQGLWTGALVAYVAGGVVAATGGAILGYQVATRPAGSP